MSLLTFQSCVHLACPPSAAQEATMKINKQNCGTCLPSSSKSQPPRGRLSMIRSVRELQPHCSLGCSGTQCHLEKEGNSGPSFEEKRVGAQISHGHHVLPDLFKARQVCGVSLQFTKSQSNFFFPWSFHNCYINLTLIFLPLGSRTKM